jgi:hypothetical protein
MLNARHSTVAPNARRAEQPRSFSFAVTWDSLTAQLQPREITSHSRAARSAPSGLTVVTPVELPLGAPPPAVSNGRWEMVVPKMVRTGPRTFARADEPSANHFPMHRPVSVPQPILETPTFGSYGADAQRPKAFAAFGRRARALLTAPDPAEEQDRLAAREMWLSRITKALRGRTGDGKGIDR